MPKSLQDQLLSAGLVNKEQVSRANASKRKKNRQQRKSSGDGSTTGSDTGYRQAQAEKARRDRELELKRSDEKESKAITAQIRQLVTINRIKQSDEGEAFNFDDQGRVKRVYISTATRDQVSRGMLAIVKVDNRYEIVPSAIARKIGSRDASAVVVLNRADKTARDSPESDPYADYQVPDDLIW